jgi:hypothetical protein
METITIEILNPKAKKLIDDLVDLELISLIKTNPTWDELWKKLDSRLPQNETNLSEEEISAEIKAYRAGK